MITAGSVNAITQYLVQEAGNADPDVQAFLKTLNEFIGIIALGTMAIDATAQIIGAAKAQQIIEESANLGESDKLPSKVTAEIEEFVGNISELVDLMNTKLADLPNIPAGENTIVAKFATITDPQEQLNFFNDFYFIDEDDPIWVEYNSEYIPNVELGLPNRTQIDDWIEISRPTVKAVRKNPIVMTAYKNFKYLDRSEFTHIKVLDDSGNGGNQAVYVTTDLSQTSVYLKIVPDDPSINSNIPSELRAIETDIVTHKFYKNLWKYNPNIDPTEPNRILINGLAVSKKSRHFVLDPLWEDQDIFEEMSYSYGVKPSNPVAIRPGNITYQDQSIPVQVSDFRTNFSDGSSVQVLVSSQGIDGDGNLVQNKVVLIAITK